MASRLKWNGERFKQHLENSTNEGLKRAAVFLHAQCQRPSAFRTRVIETPASMTNRRHLARHRVSVPDGGNVISFGNMTKQNAKLASVFRHPEFICFG